MLAFQCLRAAVCWQTTMTPDGTTPTLTIVSSPTSSANSGVVAVAADGSFTYTPATGYEGTDTFSYTVQDSDGNQDSATVSIVVNEMIWFIDDTAGSGGDGSLNAPFDSLSDHNSNTIDDNGDTIFIYTGSGTYSGGITLQSSQLLVGQGATSSLDSVAGISVPTHSNALPSTGGSRPAITSSGSGVTLAADNLVRGLNVGDTSTSSGAGISGSSVGNLTITEVSISGKGKQLTSMAVVRSMSF